MSARTSSGILCALAIPLMGIAGCGRSGPPPAPASGPQAPEFALKDLSGKEISLGVFRGNALILDFWATWCGPCHESIPVFQALYDKYRARGLTVLGVNEDAASEAVPPFVRDNRMTYPIVLDPSNRLLEVYGVRGLPTTFLVDRAGKIRGEWAGFDDEVARDMEKTLNSLLNEH